MQVTEELTDREMFSKIQLLSPVDFSLERDVHQAPPHPCLSLVSLSLVWQPSWEMGIQLQDLVWGLGSSVSAPRGSRVLSLRAKG